MKGKKRKSEKKGKKEVSFIFTFHCLKIIFKMHFIKLLIKEKEGKTEEENT